MINKLFRIFPRIPRYMIILIGVLILILSFEIIRNLSGAVDNNLQTYIIIIKKIIIYTECSNVSINSDNNASTVTSISVR